MNIDDRQAPRGYPNQMLQSEILLIVLDSFCGKTSRTWQNNESARY